MLFSPIIVQQLLQLLTGYALNKFCVSLLSWESFSDICIYCQQFSKSYEPAKIDMSPPPFPPPLFPKSMHQVIDIPEMSGFSFFFSSLFFFLFGGGLGKGFPSYSCCNADSVLQYYLPTPVPTQGKWVGERIMYSC